MDVTPPALAPALAKRGKRGSPARLGVAILDKRKAKDNFWTECTARK